jgi:hypothetical protein
LSFARLVRSTFFSQLQVKPDKNKALKDIKAKYLDYDGYQRVHACSITSAIPHKLGTSRGHVNASHQRVK